MSYLRLVPAEDYITLITGMCKSEDEYEELNPISGHLFGKSVKWLSITNACEKADLFNSGVYHPDMCEYYTYQGEQVDFLMDAKDEHVIGFTYKGYGGHKLPEEIQSILIEAGELKVYEHDDVDLPF